MVVIRFPDADAERRALGYLAGRFSFVTRDDGDTLVPESAVAALAAQDIRFEVKGKPAYEQRIATVRDAPAAAVQ